MSDWIKTKAGLQMAETINRFLPRIVASLEHIASILDHPHNHIHGKGKDNEHTNHMEI